jgi:hypothetical protein
MTVLMVGSLLTLRNESSESGIVEVVCGNAVYTVLEDDVRDRGQAVVS